jgi:hypothetical protein
MGFFITAEKLPAGLKQRKMWMVTISHGFWLLKLDSLKTCGLVQM